MKKTLANILIVIAILAIVWCLGEPADGVLDASWIAGELAGFAICFGACAAARKLNPEMFK